ncbi:D-alanyl-D-alanine carboxypeptidase family protein [Candidatus Protochlamydia phocaeensis]|uniref:D-alanyl-D-alanine carboxypeptidase family protein n=1 Tax=Candidatus Protochlamydia phocaeensis TaxID=1414722 RepID=UPI000838175A|nr:D-alanyl-D-alanine carboxypeptidase family protein [Candidatus Protochlamydia phocaeensis]
MSILSWMIAFLALSSAVFAEPLQLDIAGEAAILMNADSGVILFEKEAYIPRYPASTTKIATALYVLKFKKEDLDKVLTAEQDAVATITQEAKRKANYQLPAYWLEPDGSHIGLKKGEQMTMRDLLAGILISSGNDASNVVAQAVGGSIPRFMDQLNAYLKEIGCRQTTFYNPHGLHHPQHQTTAYDLAIMMREALKEPLFCQLIAQQRFVRPKTNKQAATTLLQTNRLIRPGKFYYSKAIGGKTGYHSKAKKNFVVAARSDDRTLIAVLMGYEDRNTIFQEAIKLFDAAFNQPKVQRIFLRAGQQSFKQDIARADRPLQTYLSENLSLDYYPAENPQAKCFLYWQPVELPIHKDQQVAELHLVDAQGKLLRKVPLLAVEDVHLKWPYSWLAKIEYVFNTFPILAVLGLGLLIVSFFSLWIIKQK